MGMVIKYMSLTTMIIMLSIENISWLFISYVFAVDFKFIVSFIAMKAEEGKVDRN